MRPLTAAAANWLFLGCPEAATGCLQLFSVGSSALRMCAFLPTAGCYSGGRAPEKPANLPPSPSDATCRPLWTYAWNREAREIQAVKSIGGRCDAIAPAATIGFGGATIPMWPSLPQALPAVRQSAKRERALWVVGILILTVKRKTTAHHPVVLADVRVERYSLDLPRGQPPVSVRNIGHCDWGYFP